MAAAGAGFRVVPVPCLDDNFAYLLIDEATKTAAAVDPVEHEKVIIAAQRENVTLTHILTTHKHWDHSGGNVALKEAIGAIEVIGGKNDHVPAVDTEVGHGDELKIGNTSVAVLQTPCHTRGHVLYVASCLGTDDPALFCGDTLFVGGCGRFFEGNAAEMNSALNEHIAALPGNTQVWCGHEYTVANLKFAVHVEPDNEVVLAKFEWAKQQRAAGRNTIPSTVDGEKSFNPFMRVDQPDVIKFCKTDDPVQVMHNLRESKNNYRG